MEVTKQVIEHRRVIRQGMFEKPHVFEYKDIFEGRPCDHCNRKNHCDDLECEKFNRWCNEFEPQKVDDYTFTIAEVAKITGKKDKFIRTLCYKGIVPYKTQAGKIRINVDHVAIVAEYKKPEPKHGLISSKELAASADVKISTIKYYCKCGKIKHDQVVGNTYYFKKERIDEVRDIKSRSN